MVVIQAGNRSAPVIDQKVQTVFSGKRGYADVDLFAAALPLLLKINASEVRGRQQPLHALVTLHPHPVAALPLRQQRLLLLDAVKGLFKILVRAGINGHFLPEPLTDLRDLLPQSGYFRLNSGNGCPQLLRYQIQPLLLPLPILCMNHPLTHSFINLVCLLPKNQV
ncbi:hypothetical protein D3C75_616230 [compost metagenome]